MYPKWPAQSTSFRLHVAQVDILSETPSLESKQPPLAGKREGMVKSSLVQT